MTATQPDPVYEAIAAFAGGLVSHGVESVVISPGSRSTPLALTLHAQPSLRTWIQIDERSAGFFALGQAKVTGCPSVLVCTSGTAAANYLPAVIEAHHSGVPLILCTADRPPELRGWGAGQTIDQVGIYGHATRWAADLPVAGDWTPAQARMAAHRAVDAASGLDSGPVHLNWPLREPLEPIGRVPIDQVSADPRGSGALPAHPDISALGDLAVAGRGVIVVGPDAATGRAGQAAVIDAALRFGARAGWPVVGEPISGVRRVDAQASAVRVAHADHLLRIDAIADELVPDVVVRVGGSPTTRAVRLWLERHRPPVVLLDPARRWNDASFSVTHHVGDDPVAVLDALGSATAAEPLPGWSERWDELDTAAERAAAEVIEPGDDRLSSAAVVRMLTATVPADTLIMASNSMPVRDLDSFVALDGPVIDFVGNRGASGIDGITSTALGLASQHEGAVVLVTGDLALLHDVGALFGAARAGLHLTIVCVDNDGGGIFSMLPIANRGDDGFETLFSTPHGLDLGGFDGIGGVRVQEIDSGSQLRAALERTVVDEGAPGVDLLVARLNRDDDLAHRRAVAAAVKAAVT